MNDGGPVGGMSTATAKCSLLTRTQTRSKYWCFSIHPRAGARSGSPKSYRHVRTSPAGLSFKNFSLGLSSRVYLSMHLSPDRNPRLTYVRILQTHSLYWQSLPLTCHWASASHIMPCQRGRGANLASSRGNLMRIKRNHPAYHISSAGHRA